MAKWILSSLKIAMKSVQMPLFHGALQSLYGMATECVAPISTVYAFMQIHSVIIHLNSCSCKLLQSIDCINLMILGRDVK